jgi:galactonate dehydratase
MRRRDFRFESVEAGSWVYTAPLLWAPGPQLRECFMKITEIRTYHAHDGARNSVFLQVLTDEGITGNGMPYSIGPDEGVLGVIENMAPWFVGQDPSRIEWLLRRAKNTMRFPLGPAAWSALSGIDHAL